jgi:hypothetical protein
VGRGGSGNRIRVGRVGRVGRGGSGICLPGLLLLAGGAVDEEGGRGGAEERGRGGYLGFAGSALCDGFRPDARNDHFFRLFSGPGPFTVSFR